MRATRASTLLGPVEPDRDPLGARGQVGGQRLVEDPEQAALEVHRQPPVRPERVELDRRRPARRPRSRAARRSVGTSPRSSRTIGRTSKMNDFVASSVCWTIATSWRTSPPAFAGSRRHEPLDDLGLEDDVRQALGRAVVHRPGDLAAEVLLGVEDQPRDGRRDAARVGGPRPPAPVLAGRAAGIGTSPERRSATRHSAASASRIPAEGPALALEDVDLRLHQRRALGQRGRAGR